MKSITSKWVRLYSNDIGGIAEYVREREGWQKVKDNMEMLNSRVNYFKKFLIWRNKSCSQGVKRTSAYYLS